MSPQNTTEGELAPRFSIVIPTYNRARFLREAIESALAQTYPAAEIIVVDDGSTDNTPEIIASLAAPTVRYIQKEHSGRPATRNRGLREAQSEFIVWVDSDDIMLPETLDKYAKGIAQYPDVDVFHGNLLVTDENRSPIRTLQYRDWYQRNDELIAEMLQGNQIPQGFSCVRKSCYDQFGGYNEDFQRFQDYEFWVRLLPHATFKLINETVGIWRWHTPTHFSSGIPMQNSLATRIVLGMLETYPLEKLIPQIDWNQTPAPLAFAAAYYQIALRFIQLKEYPLGLSYLKKSFASAPSIQAETMIEYLLSEHLPAPNPNRSVPTRSKEQNRQQKSQSKSIRKRSEEKHVLFLFPSFWPSTGGLQTIAENLGERLTERGYRVDIGTWKRNDHTETEYLGMRIIELDPNTMIDGHSMLKLQVRHLVKSGGYQTIIVQSDPQNDLIWAFEDLPIPEDTRVFILPVRNADGYSRWGDKPDYRQRLGKILRNATGALSTTRNGVEASLIRAEGIEPIYLPNAANPLPAADDFRLEHHIPADAFLILHVANLVEGENHIGLLKALKSMPDHWKLVMIGHAGEPYCAREFYKELIHHPNVLHIPGLPAPKVADAMAAADVVVLSSLGEVSPVTIVEAMSHRKPWLATATCGAVRDNAGGVIAPLEQFLPVLHVLAQNAELRSELGELGNLHYLTSYHWPLVLDGWVDLIETGELHQSYRLDAELAERMGTLQTTVSAQAKAFSKTLSSEELFEQILEAEDIHVALERYQRHFSPDFLHLVQQNREMARAEGEQELAEGLEALADAITDIVQNRANNPAQCTQKVVNIGMVTYNRLGFTRQAIDSVVRYAGYPYVLTVVDNASQDGTRQYLEALHDQGIIKNLVLLPENIGVIRASNLAWFLEPEAGFYLKLDNDIVLQKPDWLKHMVEVLEGVPQFAAVAYNVEPISYPAEEINGYRVRRPKQNINGGCILIPCRTRDRLGYWCEDYGLFGEEDKDYCLRIRHAGNTYAYLEDEKNGLHLPAGQAARTDQEPFLATNGVEEFEQQAYRQMKDEWRRKNEHGPFKENAKGYASGSKCLYQESAFAKAYLAAQKNGSPFTAFPLPK